MAPDAQTLWRAMRLQLHKHWHGQPRCVLLLDDFEQGLGFLTVWHAWRTCHAWSEGPHRVQRPQRLVVCSALQQPLSAAAIEQAHAGTPLQALAAALAAAWPPATRNLHLLDFEGGDMRLLLAVGHRQPWRQARQVQADGLWIDGRQPLAAIKTYARLAAPQASLALRNATPALQAGLQAAGFDPEPKALDDVHSWRYAPRFLARRTTAAGTPEKHAVIIGAGIAGACAAAALAQRGWRCTVLDARAQPAGGASGNPAALFHGTVHAGDGAHARFTRAAALHAQRVYSRLVARGVRGAVDGLLRAHAQAANEAVPAGWAQVWSAEDLRRNGTRLQAESAWFFPGAGWVDAAATVRALLDQPGVTFTGQAAAAMLQRQGGHDGQWQVLDAQGVTLARAPVVVLALAAAGDQRAPGADRLLHSAGAMPCKLLSSRGQVTWFDCPGPALPWPVAGHGYALSLPSELGQEQGQEHTQKQGQPQHPRLLCGATSQPGDGDAQVRDCDHQHNLARLQSLTGIAPAAGTVLQGRVGWRERTADRLPLLGSPLSVEAAQTSRAQDRVLARLPRVPGLFLMGAMAGRGFTWGPLAGELVAGWVDGGPLPLEGDLLDAVDPVRDWLRQVRRVKP